MSEETIEQAAAAATGPGPTAPPEDQPNRPEEPVKRVFKACPCGQVPERLLLEINRDSKVGRATCGTCGTWGLEFLRGHEEDPERILDKAQAAWDAGPR